MDFHQMPRNIHWYQTYFCNKSSFFNSGKSEKNVKQTSYSFFSITKIPTFAAFFRKHQTNLSPVYQ